MTEAIGDVAIVVATRDPRIAALGIDLEPAGAVTSDIADIVRRPDEDDVALDAAFVAKEAVYKAWSALGGDVLEHADIRVTIAGTACMAQIVPSGELLHGRVGLVGRLVGRRRGPCCPRHAFSERPQTASVAMMGRPGVSQPRPEAPHHRVGCHAQWLPFIWSEILIFTLGSEIACARTLAAVPGLWRTTRVAWWVVRWTLALGRAGLVVSTAYLDVLTVAAWRRHHRRPQPTTAEPVRSLAILVPAHDEQQLIGTTVASLLAQDYPAGRMSVHVVADNCTDDTAAFARDAGANVHERLDAAKPGKDGARLAGRPGARGGASIDAYVFLDADTTAQPGFLRAIDRALAGGAR